MATAGMFLNKFGQFLQYVGSLDGQINVPLASTLKSIKTYAVAIWLVTGQGFQNTKWPAVLYYQ